MADYQRMTKNSRLDAFTRVFIAGVTVYNIHAGHEVWATVFVVLLGLDAAAAQYMFYLEARMEALEQEKAEHERTV